MPSLQDFFYALATDSSDLLGGTQRSQASHSGLNNVLGIVGAQALCADVLDTNSLHDSTDSAAGDNTGAFGSGLQQNSAGAEDAEAILKGIADAKKNMVKVSLANGTIPHDVIGIFGAGTVLLKPAPEGTGVIAGGAVRAVMEAVGIKNICAKCLRSNNPQNVVKATMAGLTSLRSPEQVAAIRGKSVEEIL